MKSRTMIAHINVIYGELGTWKKTAEYIGISETHLRRIAKGYHTGSLALHYMIKAKAREVLLRA